MNERFNFKAVLKNKTDDLSKPFLENKVFDVITIGFKSDGIQTVTLLGHHKNGDYSVYEADAEDVELIQCTGLKDKNGILIYEGDIVKFVFGNKYKNGEVTYSQTIWSVSNAQFVNREYVGGSLINLYSTCEVIGNIHENAELLTECK